MRRAFVLVFLFLAAPALAWANETEFAEPLPAEQAAESMTVPDGFEVTLFAGEPDVKQPIGFCIDDRGRLWVAEAYNYPNHGSRPGDRIVILEDTNGDGRHDERTVFYDQLNYVTGIEFGFGGVWVMSPPNFYFIPDADGDDVPDGPPQVLLDGFGNHANSHNLANGFAWGPDGWLYGTHGRTNWSMIGKPGTPDDERVRFDGGVYRYHPTRHIWEPYADGTTNPWGIDWNDYGHAFVCNCVNPHLFQVIQGAHYEPWRGRQSSEFAYQRIDTIADHLHFVGLKNVRNGLGSPAEDVAGGGHAHCGTMIYLGNQFPDHYRNHIFMHNIHGRRINNDLLRRSGSGYQASHGPDFALSADPWFMGVTLAYGPAGEVYSSDWSDTGECHSVRNTRRHTGRIFRITYQQHQLPRVDLVGRSTDDLVRLQTHDNEWWVRHARRLLQERYADGEDMSRARQQLRAMFAEETDVPKKLRAMWALHTIDGWEDDDLIAMLEPTDPSVHEAIRGWAVQLLCERRSPIAKAVERFVACARLGDSPLVRLYLASALQRLPLAERWPLAEALASRSEDADDQNLPLMIWYGTEPLIENDLARYAKHAVRAKIARVRINMARRIASSSASSEGLALLFRQMADESTSTTAVSSELLTGILQGLEGRRRVSMPDDWRSAYQRLQHGGAALQEQASRLALLFEDQTAIEDFQQLVDDPAVEAPQRVTAIKALVESRIPGVGETLLNVLPDAAVRNAALRGLAAYEVRGADAAILQQYPRFDSEAKQLALQTLASRPGSASTLLDAVETQRIPVEDLTAYTARQLRSLGVESITERLNNLWGEVRETSAERHRKIQNLSGWLTPEVIEEANLVRGKELFKTQCATCHRFFGEGGQVGPDITGSQRTNLLYLLENIVDPSASVANDYRMQVIQTVDGRIISGLIESQNERTVTIVTVNDRLVIPQEEIETQKQSDVSIMPDGLLEPLTDDQIRDLIGYLQRGTVGQDPS